MSTSWITEASLPAFRLWAGEQSSLVVEATVYGRNVGLVGFSNPTRTWLISELEAELLGLSVEACAGIHVYAWDAKATDDALIAVCRRSQPRLRDVPTLVTAAWGRHPRGQHEIEDLVPALHAVKAALESKWRLRCPASPTLVPPIFDAWLPLAFQQMPESELAPLVVARAQGVAAAVATVVATVKADERLARAVFAELQTEWLWRRRARRGYRVDRAELDRLQSRTDRLSPERASLHGSVKMIGSGIRRDGRLHPVIQTLGAVTGRMTTSAPNMHGVAKAVRPMLLAEEGHVLVSADLNHIEPTVVAALSGDEALIGDVQIGRDPYRRLAAAIWGDEAASDDSKRKVAKRALLAQLYGQGPAALARDLEMERAAIDEVLAALWRRYRGLRRWSREVTGRARAGLGLVTGYGRPIGVPEKPYQAVNHLVQGTAADYFKRAVIRADDLLSAQGLRKSAWLPLHDELIVEVPRSAAAVALASLKTGMDGEISGVPVTAEAVVLGHSWA